MSWHNFVVARSLEETVSILHKNKGKAQVLAGGTDLLVQLRNNEKDCNTLVDITGLDDLKIIEETNGFIRVGSLVTHDQIASSSVVLKKAKALSEAAHSVGSPQIRNVGTIGGNVVNAQPAADTSIALLSLDAKVHILTRDGIKEIPVKETFFKPGQSRIDPTSELVLSFSFKAVGTRERSVFYRLARRKALCLPTLNMAIWIKFEEESTLISNLRIAVGPVSLVPSRVKKTEDFLVGKKVTGEILERAAQLLSDECNPRDSLRGSACYKKEMAGVFLKKAIISTLDDIRSDPVG